MRSWLYILPLAGLLPFVVHAQVDKQSATSPARVLPYIAHFKITRTIVMPNGAITTLVSVETAARDSQGRLYTETKRLSPSGSQTVPENSTSAYKLMPDNTSQYYVSDPAANTFATWDSNRNVVRTYQYSEEVHGKSKGCWADSQGKIQLRGPEESDWHSIPPGSKSRVWVHDTSGTRHQVQETVEDLGTKIISGFTARGLRISTESLPDAAPDNELTHTDEFWRSDELNLKLSETSTAPFISDKPAKLTNTKIKELIDLKLDEPDLSLFLFPKDYSVERIELHRVPCDQN